MKDTDTDNPLQGETAVDALPEDLQDVAVSVIDSFVSIWDSFIAHTPYIVGAVFVLIATWGIVVTAVKQALDSAEIEIPFPYRTLTFKEPLVTRRSSGS